eukprot:Platyproteum_vivax@DN6783_c0_g1_i1.p1
MLRAVITDKEQRKSLLPNILPQIARATAINSTIFCCGDLISQHLWKEKKEGEGVDFQRMTVVTVEGGLLNGICLYPFHCMLDVVYGPTSGPTGRLWPGVLQKIVASQLFYSLVTTLVFLIVTRTAQAVTAKTPRNESAQEFLFTYIKAYLNSWVVWPLSDLVSFSFLPVRWRSTWDSLVDIWWTAYMSDLAHRRAPVDDTNPIVLSTNNVCLINKE